MSYPLKSVKEHLQDMYTTLPGWNQSITPQPIWIVYDPTTEHGSAHDVANWIFELEKLKETVRQAGYTNPTLVLYKSWCFDLMVDEVEQMYAGYDRRRKSICDIAVHSGLGMGCSNGYTTQLIYFERFQREGLNESHGHWDWSAHTERYVAFACFECFPAKYAEQRAADEAAGLSGVRGFAEARRRGIAG